MVIGDVIQDTQFQVQVEQDQVGQTVTNELSGTEVRSAMYLMRELITAAYLLLWSIV